MTSGGCRTRPPPPPHLPPHPTSSSGPASIVLVISLMIEGTKRTSKIYQHLFSAPITFLYNLFCSLGDGVVYPLREEIAPERCDLLNERAKWIEEGDSCDDEPSTRSSTAFTYFETVNEHEPREQTVEITPDVVTYK